MNENAGYTSPTMSTNALEVALRLPVTERIELVQAIWDSVVAESAAVPFTASKPTEDSAANSDC